MELQPMSLRHIKAVVEIEDLVYDEPWSARQFRRSIKNDNNLCYVAIDTIPDPRTGGEIEVLCGYMVLFESSNNWVIENLTVHPDNRRQGIATSFLGLVEIATKGEPVTIYVADTYLPMHLCLKYNGYTAIGIDNDKGEDYYVFVNKVDDESLPDTPSPESAQKESQ